MGWNALELQAFSGNSAGKSPKMDGAVAPKAAERVSLLDHGENE